MEALVDVVVGEVYPVPCVHGDHGCLVPVFPVPHHDRNPEFFVNVPEHYHVDNRFIDFNPHTAIRAAGKELLIQERACLREVHEPPKDIVWMHLALLAHFEGHRLSKGCHTCPHKGMPIINGVCQGHGLKWNADGYLKHRGPFKMAWMNNMAPIENLKQVIIPITVAASGPLILDIYDGRGEHVLTHTQTRSYPIVAHPGDVVKINNDEARLFSGTTS